MVATLLTSLSLSYTHSHEMDIRFRYPGVIHYIRRGTERDDWSHRALNQLLLNADDHASSNSWRGLKPTCKEEQLHAVIAIKDSIIYIFIVSTPTRTQHKAS
jgi:hypothetical protein